MRGPPQTLKEAQSYRYGKWAGNPQGRSYCAGNCIAEFVPNERGATARQCNRKAITWCSSHDPERIAQQQQARNEVYETHQAQQDRIYKRGQDLVRRLGVGRVHYESRSRPFLGSGYRQEICLPFEFVEDYLKKEYLKKEGR